VQKERLAQVSIEIATLQSQPQYFIATPTLRVRLFFSKDVTYMSVNDTLYTFKYAG